MIITTSKLSIPIRCHVLNTFRYFKPHRHISTTCCLFEDESSSNNDSNQNDKGRNEKSKEAIKKLNELLQLSMKREKIRKSSGVEIPQPRVLAREKRLEEIEEKEKQSKEIKESNIGRKLSKAASMVAKEFGGDEKKTEKELLDIFLSKPKIANEGEEVHKSTSAKKGEETVNLSDIVTGMKVDKDQKIPQGYTRAHQIKTALGDRRMNQFVSSSRIPSRRKGTKVDIHGEISFNIFNKKEIEEKNVEPVELETWARLNLKELRLCVTHPARNIFEEMAQWTEEGKMWRFPIDNEQDTPEEAKVDFTEHVFLEHYLEPWCPDQGPVRQFMELVCVGLSMNPYYTVQEKKDHIAYYEDYFREKNHLLKATGAGEIKERQEAVN